jgi:hypothetical protein
LSSFEEAFATLIREIETLKKLDLPTKIDDNAKINKPIHHPHGPGVSAIDTIDNLLGMYLL